jgi:RNA 2',3'-cyclic 3'-phosphodiesterase
MKRIFIALKIEAGELLLSIISSLKTELNRENIRWTSPGNIHITLAFLGDTNEEQINAVSAMLKEKCKGFGRFELIIKGPDVFKIKGKPRVIWTGIEFSEKLVLLNHLIIEGLKETGTKIEDRPFNPHLTIGRIKFLKDNELLKNIIHKYQNVQIQKMEIYEVILYESILLQTGPVYKPIAKFKL